MLLASDIFPKFKEGLIYWAKEKAKHEEKKLRLLGIEKLTIEVESGIINDLGDEYSGVDKLTILFTLYTDYFDLKEMYFKTKEDIDILRLQCKGIIKLVLNEGCRINKLKATVGGLEIESESDREYIDSIDVRNIVCVDTRGIDTNINIRFGSVALNEFGQTTYYEGSSSVKDKVESSFTNKSVLIRG